MPVDLRSHAGMTPPGVRWPRSFRALPFAKRCRTPLSVVVPDATITVPTQLSQPQTQGEAHDEPARSTD
jgi:hypothetical protein